VHPRVAVHEFSTGSLAFVEELELWTDLGVTNVGLVPAKVDIIGRDEAAVALGERSLRVSSMFGGTFFDLTDPDSWTQSQAELESTLEWSASLGAGCVYVVPGRAGGLPWERLFDNFRAAIAPSATRARELGVRLAFEPCAQIRTDISFVNQLDDAIDVAEATGLGVLVDFAACWMQRGLAQRFHDLRDHIALVQVSDVAIGSLVSPDRRVPGDGDLPLRTLLEQVLATGYDGPFELEVFGPAIDDEGTTSAIARATDRLSALLDQVGA
jgi:sugar phosphate isomerase/epimerase